MLGISGIKNGTVFKKDDVFYQILWFQHHKPGKGGAMLRTKIKNLKTGSIFEQTFKSGEKFREIPLKKIKKQFLYADQDQIFLMDLETFEQFSIPVEGNKTILEYLKEGSTITTLFLDGEFLSIELPVTVELVVQQAEPGVKGDSVSNVTKECILETGIKLQVPLFINEGDTIKVDTREGVYIARV